MKRNKEWWAKFTPYERGYICWIERLKSNYKKYGVYYLLYDASIWIANHCPICKKNIGACICNECMVKYQEMIDRK